MNVGVLHKNLNLDSAAVEGSGSPVLYNVPMGMKIPLTINVGALILALHAISDKQIHRSAVKFDWEEKRNS